VRRKIGQPRFIDPSLVETGDEISVEHTVNKGVTTTVRGIVAERLEQGSMRRFITSEGGTLMAWEPGRIAKIRVTLYAREEPENATIF
jgi:hypothetical protein